MTFHSSILEQPMISSLTDGGPGRFIAFYEVPIGKKIVSAVTGAVLFAYVLGHLFGNLQIYLGREQINGYAEFLHSLPAPLWVVRAFLLAIVTLHVLTAVQLWLLKRKARPVSYLRGSRVPPGYASRTMYWTGPLVAIFVVSHVLHLTTGSLALPYQELDAFDNVVNGFRIPAVAASYIAFMLVLCMHLYHGLWSMFQTVGVSHPRYTPLLKRLAAVAAVGVAVGNISIPLAVLAGLVGN
jgi:succinate dehydrogenase / fumarate reductase cytochrome b subunit